MLHMAQSYTEQNAPQRKAQWSTGAMLRNKKVPGHNAPHGIKLHWAKRSTAQGTMIHLGTMLRKKKVPGHNAPHGIRLHWAKGSTEHKAARGTMPYNLQCSTTTRQKMLHRTLLPQRIQWGFYPVLSLSPLLTWKRGFLSHRIQGFLSPFLTGYRGFLFSVSSQDSGIPVPLPHRIYKFCGLLVSRKENICISLVLVAHF